MIKLGEKNPERSLKKSEKNYAGIINRKTLHGRDRVPGLKKAKAKIFPIVQYGWDMKKTKNSITCLSLMSSRFELNNLGIYSSLRSRGPSYFTLLKFLFNPKKHPFY